MKKASQNLAKGLTFKTISYENESQINYDQFKDMHVFIDNTYPLLNSKLEKVVINNYTLLYKWHGTNPSSKAIVFMAHQDVVPAEQPNRWTHPPFAGVIDNGTIYGRGALDDKNAVFGILEAVEHLLKKGFQPTHTIYLLFGHDEEIGGLKGAKSAVDYLKNNDVDIQLVLDEGGQVLVNVLNGIEQPIAMIGIGEKGYLDFQLSAYVQPGHSSMPLRDNAIQVLANAIKAIQDNPMPPVFDNLTLNTLKQYAPYVSNQTIKEIFENPLKNKTLSEEIISKDPFFNAQMRTVITPTIINGGVKSNIIPSDASATFNVRIHTGDNIESVLDHVKNVINDSRIDIKTGADFAGFNPSILPETKHPSFDILEKVVKDVFGRDTPVIPFLTFATTDSKYFQNIGYGDAVYRLNAVDMNKSESQSIHGYDERIPIDSYERYIKFMIMFIKESNNLS
jgi:carboxypeptidase PM20D1